MQSVPAIPDLVKLRRASGAPRRLRDRLTVVLFLLPALALFLLLVIYPIFRSVYYSLFNWNGLGPAVHYVGLSNFVKILTDRVFILALRNGLLIVAFSLLLQLPMSLLLAVLVGRNLPGRAFFRTIFC